MYINALPSNTDGVLARYTCSGLRNNRSNEPSVPAFPALRLTIYDQNWI